MLPCNAPLQCKFSVDGRHFTLGITNLKGLSIGHRMLRDVGHTRSVLLIVKLIHVKTLVNEGF